MPADNLFEPSATENDMHRKTRKPTTVTVYQNGKPVFGMEHIWGVEIARRKADALTGPYEIRRDRDGYLAAERKA